MILAGVLLKMGGYGLIRMAYPFFPDAARTLEIPVVILALISIVYGAFVAMAQTDFKKLVAYSSVSHMGFVTLGIASLRPEGVNGAMYMMLAHGTISAMLFMLVGVIYERAHHRDIDRFGGLAWVMPKYFALAAFGIFASLGLPGLSGFVAEITVFLGSFDAHPRLTLIATIGMVVTAAYYLITLQKVYLGDTPAVYKDASHYPDVSGREILILVPLALVTLWMGVLPAHAMDVYRVDLEHDLRQRPHARRGAVDPSMTVFSALLPSLLLTAGLLAVLFADVFAKGRRPLMLPWFSGTALVATAAVCVTWLAGGRGQRRARPRVAPARRVRDRPDAVLRRRRPRLDPRDARGRRQPPARRRVPRARARRGARDVDPRRRRRPRDPVPRVRARLDHGLRPRRHAPRATASPTRRASSTCSSARCRRASCSTGSRSSSGSRAGRASRPADRRGAGRGEPAGLPRRRDPRVRGLRLQGRAPSRSSSGRPTSTRARPRPSPASSRSRARPPASPVSCGSCRRWARRRPRPPTRPTRSSRPPARSRRSSAVSAVLTMTVGNLARLPPDRPEAAPRLLLDRPRGLHADGPLRVDAGPRSRRSSSTSSRTCS